MTKVDDMALTAPSQRASLAAGTEEKRDMSYPGDGWLPPILSEVTEEDYLILRAQQRCAWCAKRRLPNGNDPCLGTLPGVSYACCGHGVRPGYVAFSDNRHVIRGEFENMPALGWGHEHREDVLDAGFAAHAL